MLAGNAKRIFCDNVTCFGTNESCWNRSHLPEFFIKAPHFLLAWLLCFFTQTPRFYIFLGGDLCNTHDCPGQNNSYFGLENQGWKMSFVFWYGILPGSFRFQTWCGDFQFRGCISTRTLSSNQSNSHDVNTAKNARSSKKGWESWSSTFQSCFSMFQIKRRVVGLYRAFSNRPWYYQFGYRM